MPLNRKIFPLLIYCVLLPVCARAQNTIALPDSGLVEVNGTRLFVRTMGQGPSILFLHGGPGLDHSYFLPQMGRLARHHRLIFFDQRGCGRSSVDVDSSSINMKTFVADIEALRKKANLGRMNLLGHSWGGLLAMYYASQYPQNLATLVLLNTTPASTKARNASFAVMQNRTTPEDSIALAGIVSTPAFRQRNPATMAIFFRLLFKGTFCDRRYADSLTFAFSENLPKTSALMKFLVLDPSATTYDLTQDLDRISCPTLILGGDCDLASNDALEEIHSHIKESQVIVFRNAGHFPYIEAPDSFFPAVERFLHEAGQ
ncbi:MAG TPA: alpha/beta fold hydrolase [Bacteroidota bacterium]|nr:alpha/beta fold hydrolase [Bacteroidota bacterium]